MFEVVEFPSEGALLRGRFYRPERAAPFPVVVMTHGTTATITMALDHYAEVFCRAGLAVLLYDHRNFGMSGGEPRQQINPWIQARGYRDAVNYLLTRSGCPSRPDSGVGRQLLGDDRTCGRRPRAALRRSGRTMPCLRRREAERRAVRPDFRNDAGGVCRRRRGWHTRNDGRSDARRFLRSGGLTVVTQADPGIPVVHRLRRSPWHAMGKPRDARQPADAVAIQRLFSGALYQGAHVHNGWPQR